MLYFPFVVNPLGQSLVQNLLHFFFFFFSERFDLHEEKKIGFDPGKKKKTGSLKTNWLVKPRYY